MIHHAGIGAFLAAVVLTAGCATVEKTALSSDSKKNIKTVAVVGVTEPEKYTLNPGQAPGGALLYVFGTLGGLVLGGIEASRAEAATNEFTAPIKPTNPDTATHWNELVHSHLQSKGYEVTMLPPLPVKAGTNEFDRSSTAGKFDAVLLSSISTGYAVESDVEPRITASLRLVSSDCTDIHFSEGLLYSATPLGAFTHIERDTKFAFPTREALLSSPETAREALRTGLSEIAKKATSDF